jgi:hypothetical protein
MEWDELTPEQQRQVEADHADYEVQLARVGVDMRAASARMNEVQAPRRSEITGEGDEESFTETFTVDFSGILNTLRLLPDGAGTAAFIAAYNAEHRDWRDGKSSTRYSSFFGTRRWLKAGLTIAGVVAGALFGLMLTRLGKIAAEAPAATLANYAWNAAVFAMVGGVLTPVVSWSTLRNVPLWRSSLNRWGWHSLAEVWPYSWVSRR